MMTTLLDRTILDYVDVEVDLESCWFPTDVALDTKDCKIDYKSEK